ncbi:MAG: carboxypeptidase regulatory-like domain-containing protein [Acidobacteria bacterium]|nr:carboxypeptidase regulatory-like domain-containing protein [Acidobacteriota bacterium]
MGEFGMKSRTASLLIFLLSVPLSLAVAQTTGTISGTVTDATSATVPGAKVVIRNVASGDQREVSTSATGQYTFPLLPPGNYEI